MYTETWFIKRTKDSEPEKVILFFEHRYQANVLHAKAVEENNPQIFFGKAFPKDLATAWQ